MRRHNGRLLQSTALVPVVAARRPSRWLAGAIIGAGSLFATQAMAIDVANQTDWNTAVAAVAAAGAGSTVSINITAGFTLASSLAQLQASNANVSVNITGNGQTINGASSFQGIQVNGANALTVTIANLAITNTAALGGNGQNGQAGYYSAGLSYGSGGGGGGGLGAGGGLMVGSGANVVLSAVTFTGSTATGGTGGTGGSAQNTAADPINGGNGGTGGAANNGGASGGGGAGGTGGHAGGQGTNGTAGGSFGAGGGGGGGSGTNSSTNYTTNNSGGAGNASGGNGGNGGDGVTNNNGSQGPGSDGGAGGAGGSAQGGAIYVATGGTLTILDTPISGAAVVGGAGGSSGVGQGPSSFNGSAGAAGTAQGAGIFLSGVTANIGVSGGTVTYGNTIGGTGLTTGGINTAINKTGSGTLVLSAANTFIGNVNITAGTLAVAGTGNLGNAANRVAIWDGATFAVTSTATFANTRLFSIAGLSTFAIAPGTTTTIQGVISNGASAGSLVKADTGTLLLSGTNTYTGETIVNGGTLRAGSAGAFGASTVFGVASGATLDLNGFDRTFGSLSGAGTVTGANATISGTFAPGNGTPGSSMAIGGNLTFQAGSQYLVQVNPTTASFATVTGTATLGGATVGATFAPGAYVQRHYTILTAAGGISGTFGAVSGINTPTNLHSTLSYDANNAYLDLILNFAIPGGLNANQQNVGNALTNFFNTTGGIAAVYANLSANGLSQAAGETGTGSQQTTFGAMTQFMGVMTDPFIAGRDGTVSPGGGALGYADEEAMAYAATRNANNPLAAMYTKAVPAAVPLSRWSVWAAGFGGSQTTDGNAGVGSNTATSRIYGTVVGLDYRFSPFTIAGFALAGGGTNYSVANNGNGSSDLFQAGAFVRHTVGAAYLSGALAYGWQDITTDRTVTIAGTDRLRARFTANAWSGRVESGYRFLAPVAGGVGITPYAAGQFTTFDLPSYTESVVSGANTFALGYGAKSVTDSRSELGVRTDKSYLMDAAILTLRARAAWAHDFNPDRGIGATFQALPGASFVVNGAAQASDSALVTASADVKWLNGWSTAATFEGEFSNVTRSYAGKGVVRYAW
ncbi:autotransporter domain-containing protein [Rhodoplanes sp.]|uniref:autotransporter outer membrane beta-barrel domain-containing protein n=1 Tax=Rhodoplanes sp. TaxID=1968906 RepID=UPI0025E0B28F|nr:autotransporter domain-containing protein [Rhodoplanes sp.]